MNQRILKKMRTARGISQMRLAQLSGVSRNRISLADCGYLELSNRELFALEKTLNKISKKIPHTHF